VVITSVSVKTGGRFIGTACCNNTHPQVGRCVEGSLLGRKKRLKHLTFYLCVRKEQQLPGCNVQCFLPNAFPKIDRIGAIATAWLTISHMMNSKASRDCAQG